MLYDSSFSAAGLLIRRSRLFEDKHCLMADHSRNCLLEHNETIGAKHFLAYRHSRGPSPQRECSSCIRKQIRRVKQIPSYIRDSKALISIQDSTNHARRPVRRKNNWNKRGPCEPNYNPPNTTPLQVANINNLYRRPHGHGRPSQFGYQRQWSKSTHH